MLCDGVYIGAQPTRSGKWILYLGDSTPWGLIPTVQVWSDEQPDHELGDSVKLDVVSRGGKTYFKLVP